MAKKHNIAVIGYGYWGPNIVRNFENQTNATVSMLCDASEEQLKIAKELYPHLNTTTEFRDVLVNDDIDAVAIVTPPATHFELARQALEAGKHVLVEKPLTTEVAEAEKLVALAKEKNLVLMVDHTFLFNSPFEKAKEVVNQDSFGAVKVVDFFFLNLGLFQPSGVIWDLAPHMVSIVLDILQDHTITSVSTQGRTGLEDGLIDSANLFLTFSSGLVASLHVSWYYPRKVREFNFVGEKQMLILDDMKTSDKLVLLDKSSSKTADGYDYIDNGSTVVEFPVKEALSNVCSSFLESIPHKKSLRSSGELGLDVVKVVAAAIESVNNNGKEVMI